MKKILLPISLVAFSLMTTISCTEKLEGINPQTEVQASASEKSAKTVGTVTATVSEVSSNETSFGTYIGYVGVDYDGKSIVTIKGTNFGSKTGSVSFSDANFSVSSISSWTDTRIVVIAKSKGTNAVAVKNATVTVNPISDATTTRKSGSRTVSFVSTVFSRQYLQCTWWCSIRRIDSGLKPQTRGESYTNLTGSISNSYIPQKGDIWVFSDKHQCFVESVVGTPIDTYEKRVIAGKSTNVLVARTTTYVVKVSEYNIISESYSDKTPTIVIKTDMITGVKTRVSGLFNSGYKSEATSYFR